MEFTIEELEKFAKGTEVFMAILDDAGVFLKANIRWEERFDFSDNHVQGSSIFDLIHEAEIEDFKDVLQQSKTTGHVSHQIVTMIARDLQAVSIQLDLTFTDNTYYLVGFDVTDHAREHTSLVDMSKLSKTGAWYYDPIRDQTFWTDEVYRIHELEVDTNIDANRALSFYSGEHQAKIQKLVDRLYEAHEAYEFAGEIITAKGNKKWIRTIAKPMIQDGKIIYICGVTIDQTRLHNNLERIKYESETRMLALKGIKSGLFDHDLVKDTASYSPTFKEMVNLPTERDLPESEFRKMIHPDEQEEAYQRHLEQVNAPGNHYFNYYRLYQEGRGYEHFEVYGWRKKDDQGKTVRMVGNLINVHKKVLAEQENERIKGCLEAMVNNGYIYSILIDKDGFLLMADEKATKIIIDEYGLDPRKERVKYRDAMPDIFKKGYEESFQKVLEGETVRKEVEIPALTGAMGWFDIMYHPIKNQSGEVTQVLLNFSDITERKRAEVSIKEAANQAQSLNRLKSGILSNLSHEMRTPLNGIMGATNFLLSKQLDSESAELLTMQKESEERMLKILNDLITLSDLDAMRLNMRLKQYTLNEIAQYCFELYNHLAKKKQLDFSIKKTEEEAIVLVDHEMIQSALAAIVNNALKYTAEGSVQITCSSDEQEMGEIRIIDTGIGIEESSKERIFENFEVGNIGLNLKYEGAGIGLSIAKKFIQLMGGTIELESELGKGSTFIVRLPVVSDSD